mmetsp:Transcript_8399/g.14132  ORF Transcript_8399/g.14132 Transcript_8399/m.14132 type:complete len:200 (+) Transcript_8399:215-814(+)
MASHVARDHPSLVVAPKCSSSARSICPESSRSMARNALRIVSSLIGSTSARFAAPASTNAATSSWHPCSPTLLINSANSVRLILASPSVSMRPKSVSHAAFDQPAPIFAPKCSSSAMSICPESSRSIARKACSILLELYGSTRTRLLIPASTKVATRSASGVHGLSPSRNTANSVSVKLFVPSAQPASSAHAAGGQSAQ